MYRSIYYGYFIGFEQAIKKISTGQLNDELTLKLLGKVISEYEGGSFDNDTYHIPQNEKDKKIQSLMREQLEHPANKATLLKVMDLLYFLESDCTQLLEETIRHHDEILSDKEKLAYRLHYASNNIDKFTTLINQVNAENKHGKNYYDEAFYGGLSNFLDYEFNELNTKSVQKAVKIYLENNPVSLESIEERADFFYDYGCWLRAYAAATGESDIDKSLYETAIRTKDPVKILAILDALIDGYEPEIYTSKYYQKVLHDKAVQQCLENTYFDSDREDIKSEIAWRLRGVTDSFPDESCDSEPRELPGALLTMPEEEKMQLKQNLNEALKYETFFRKLMIRWLLIRYF